ncbi:MAG: sn-glycerol 3-phosphate transport system ATP-binding protein [Parasphingorhabdus sp.]|jgi:sn-glycerol 3-phosphate transport system ATP-binding protein
MTGIKISQLVKQWDTTRAVDGVSFTADEGTLTVLLGPSGCGKSTILRMIAGLETVDGGEVQINEQVVTHQDPAKRGVSMVFQSYALFPHLDVRENILFGLKVRRVDPVERESRLKDAAQLVGLEGLLDRRPAQLSGGQRQRVALARTIVSKQPVCLMDEPLSNLDAQLRAEMRDEIQQLQKRLNLTMVYVTHDQTEAMSMADQVILLKDGKIQQTGTPMELYEQPASGFVAQFLGTPPMNLMPTSLLKDTHADKTGAAKLGIRPEKVRITETGLKVEVKTVDYMGAETVLRMRHGSCVLMARIEGRASVRAGDSIHISWSKDDEYLFGQDGQRICGGSSVASSD